MPDTFVKIASVSLVSGSASSIDFTSIPSTYTDLIIKVSARNTAASGLVYYSFNGNSSNRTARLLYGSGSAAGSVTYDNTDPRAMIMNESGYTASAFSSGEMYIPNYAASNNKSWSSDSVQETNATTAFSYLMAGIWSDTTAISSITFGTFTGNFAQYTTATLYGIKNS